MIKDIKVLLREATNPVSIQINAVKTMEEPIISSFQNRKDL